MSLGVYFHIPYCIQKCYYCDFATRPQTSNEEMFAYTQLLQTEITNRRNSFAELTTIESIYFGGGTPSLLPTENIVTLLNTLNNVGFKINPDAEITIEINPGTIDQKKLDLYRAAGINRYSVGVQSFNDQFLHDCGREHSANESRKTLQLLKKNDINYSFDLLFGLKNQSLRHLNEDLSELLEFNPPHVSAYLMTLPEGHILNVGRAHDEEQAEMFFLISKTLELAGWQHYEISNYAKPGFQSRHNLRYWNDQAYWGIGLSAHSYRPDWGAYGTRFWNPKNTKKYEDSISLPLDFEKQKNSSTHETLKPNEALTDFLHTQLRKSAGLNLVALRSKFKDLSPLAEDRLATLVKKDWLDFDGISYKIEPSQKVLANKIFFELTFLPEELTPSLSKPY